MNIAIMGAGAVGTYFGALLAQAGHAVTLIGREAHVAAIRAQGVLLESGGRQARIALGASTQAEAVRGADLVLCCVKSADTLAAARAMAPHLAPTARVLSLQNGLGNAETLAQALPGQAIAAVLVYAAVGLGGPGHVIHRGGGELVMAADALDAAASAAFRDAGIPVRLSDNLAGEQWTKLALNCCWNALSAITQQNYGQLWRNSHVEPLLRDILRECLAVAAAEGVGLAQDPWPAIVRVAQQMPGQTSSTAQDLARQRASEIDQLNGHVVRRGEAHGIPTPANRALHALVKLLEAQHG